MFFLCTTGSLGRPVTDLAAIPSPNPLATYFPLREKAKNRTDRLLPVVRLEEAAILGERFRLRTRSPAVTISRFPGGDEVVDSPPVKIVWFHFIWLVERRNPTELSE
jgi:hypothetical protein